MTKSWKSIAIDSGGTFTDVIALSENSIRVFKLPSTPSNPEEAVINAISELGGAEEIFHGTTVATNAILERKGAEVVLITTKGFKDVIEIGRQIRDDIYSLYPTRPTPLVANSNRFEIEERIGPNGEVLKRLKEEELDSLIEKIDKIKPTSIAISLLFSFLYPNHEEIILQKLENKYAVSLSSFIHPEYREYERTSTTVVDAYVKPVITSYLNSLNEKIIAENYSNLLAVMKSDGGLALANSVASKPVDTIFSGLAGGTKASEFVSKVKNNPNLLTIDIGGTSTDVSVVINGIVEIQQNQKVDGLPVSRPSVDVITIGAGGGSQVSYFNGILKVGPESAGAEPGPISYGKGGKILTMTDIDLLLGLLPNELAGGVLSLNQELILPFIERLAIETNMSVEGLVVGIRRIFHENIVGALRSVSTQRGYDPRKFTLLGFGGAGPLHAVEIAEVLGITNVLIPPFPGIWSSVGLLGADYVYANSQGNITKLSNINETEIKEILNELKRKSMNQAISDKIEIKDERVEFKLDLRYVGQSYELSVIYEGIPKSIENFIELHNERYGFAARHEPIELVSLKCIMTIPHKNPELPEFKSRNELKDGENTKIMDVGTVKRLNKYKIPTYQVVDGPFLIQQNDTTIYVPPKWQFEIDNLGFVMIKKN